MAGEWIKLEHTTPDKPEVRQMARELGVKAEQVVGHLARIWIWADQQSLNGHAISVTDSDIDDAARHAGFAQSMRNVGWLLGEEGRISFPKFTRHNSKSSKKRALAAGRKRTQRSRSERDKNVTREEKRRVERKLQPLHYPEGVTEADWQGFLDSRQKLRKPMTGKAEQLALAKLHDFARQGYDPRKLLNLAIESGWLTFFPRDDCRAGAQGAPGAIALGKCDCGAPATMKVGGKPRCANHARGFEVAA